jgi:hypothetical protein
VFLVSCYFAWDNIGPDQRPDSLLRLVEKLNIFGTSLVVDLDQNLNLSEDNIESQFEDLYFGCSDEWSSLGDRVCWAYISNFNGIPANIVSFFFEKNSYKFLRVGIDKKNHKQLKLFIDDNFTYMGISPNSRTDVGQNLGVWTSKSGRITTTLDKPAMDKPSIILWQKM